MVFIGERCEYGVSRALLEGFPSEAALGFYNLEEAAEWLRGELTAGDVALLRGTHSQHFGRIYFRMLGTVECTLVNCRMRYACDYCPELGFREKTGAGESDSRPVQSLPET